jgi:alkylhydroperoxidase family enzyme
MRDGVIAVADGADSAELDAVDRAVVAFARKVALHADQVTEQDIDALRAQGLADDEIFDVVLAAAARCFFSKTLDATGTLADAAFQELDPRLRDALTVGRPIDA